MRSPDRRLLRSAVLEVVENQLRDLDPPETKETLDRLISEGASEEAARQLIGAVVAAGMWRVMTEQQPFDQTRFVEDLRKLPTLPDD